MWVFNLIMMWSVDSVHLQRVPFRCCSVASPTMHLREESQLRSEYRKKSSIKLVFSTIYYRWLCRPERHPQSACSRLNRNGAQVRVPTWKCFFVHFHSGSREPRRSQTIFQRVHQRTKAPAGPMSFGDHRINRIKKRRKKISDSAPYILEQFT